MKNNTAFKFWHYLINRYTYIFGFFLLLNFPFAVVSQLVVKQTGVEVVGALEIGMSAWADYKVALKPNSTLHPIVIYDDKNQNTFIDFWNASTGANAGITTRYVTNKPNTNVWNIATIEKYRNGLWRFKNFDSAGKIEFDIQDTGNNTPELVIEGDGGVKFPSAGIKFGGAITAGSLRWTGTDFEGYNGSQWKSLLNNQLPPQSYWATASTAANCSSVCAAGYAPGADQSGLACRGDTYPYSGTGAVQENNGWHCALAGRLTQCHCIKITP